jgi:hypothetical protein
MMAVMPLAAQETYENANIAAEDLNGTARYIGMGGAMDALGADISTISTNPAGIGLFRKSGVSLSMSLLTQHDKENFADGHKTNLSFDQVGLVWANQISETDFVNFGFNYHKSRNFNQLMSVMGALDNASQNKATVTKRDNGLLFEEDAAGVPDFNNSYSSCTILDDLYARNLNYNATDKKWYAYNGEEYVFDRTQSGYTAEYDFNISGNVSNTFYWGVTLGLHDVNYRRYTLYSENLIGGLGGVPDAYGVTIEDDRDIKGNGFDLKLGAIFRPIEESPFRFGVSIATPTWYSLRTTSYTTFNDNTGCSEATSDEYKFKLYTPWKFGLSLGHTIDNFLAIGLGYEFADYSAMDSRNLVDGYYDDYEDSRSDKEMNRHTSETLKGVSTIKAGIELKPVPEMAVRLGYNYVSPMYKKDGYKDSWIESMGSYHSSTTDFTNWESTHRITCGLGYQIKSWNVAMAYQYSVRNGFFAPFDSYVDNVDASYDNVADMVKVSDKRSQFLLTIGYTF